MTKEHNKKDRSVYRVPDAQALIDALPTPVSNTAVAGVATLAPRTLDKIVKGGAVTHVSCKKFIDALRRLGKTDIGHDAIEQIKG